LPLNLMTFAQEPTLSENEPDCGLKTDVVYEPIARCVRAATSTITDSHGAQQRRGTQRACENCLFLPMGRAHGPDLGGAIQQREWFKFRRCRHCFVEHGVPYKSNCLSHKPGRRDS